jgi:hypothetical protein
VPPPEPAQEESAIESIIHHSWGHRHARKEIPVVRESPVRQAAPASVLHAKRSCAACKLHAHLARNASRACRGWSASWKSEV